jgi:hypothetical protein
MLDSMALRVSYKTIKPNMFIWFCTLSSAMRNDMLHAAHVNRRRMISQVLRNGSVQTIAFCIHGEAQFERHRTVSHHSN